MKSWILASAFIFSTILSTVAMAADVGQITMSAPDAASVSTEKNNFTEGGFNFTSLNDGTLFATVGLFHEWDNGFAIGARGYMPLQFTKQVASYLGQGVARFIIMNEQDQMFIEGTVAQGWFNGDNNGTPFVLLGSDFGYVHHFDKQLALGGMIGLDYSNDRVSGDAMSRQRTLYNRISAVGSYYF